MEDDNYVKRQNLSPSLQSPAGLDSGRKASKRDLAAVQHGV